MIFNKLFCFSVVLVLVGFRLSSSQLVDQAVETTDAPSEVTAAPLDTEAPSETEAPSDTEAPSTLICSICACADSVVDCVNLNISIPFELTDWEGLTSFNPITVNLSYNPLTTITRFSKLPIQALNLSNCDIETIEAASFIYLEQLKSIDLSYNKISTSDLSRKVFVGPLGPDGPQNFKFIQELSLAYNDIHSLPQDLFLSLTTMTTLDLSGNPLAYIDQVSAGAISDLINLRHLKLSGCELETLPEGLLRRLRKLRYLNLSNNRFTTIPDVLKEVPKLISLNLDKNAFQTIDATTSISSLTSLQELRLSRMSRLQNITAGALGGLINLRILKISHNPRLTILDPHFLMTEDEDGIEQWPLVKELYLNNNKLSTIDSHFLDSWNDLTSADFSNNPFVCDCNSQWMVDVLTPLMANLPQENTVNNMVCKKPADVRGLTFAQLNNSSRTLVCAESESITDATAVSKLAVILGFMIGIIVTFPIVLILVLLWKRGHFARCRAERKQSYPGYHDDENEYL